MAQPANLMLDGADPRIQEPQIEKEDENGGGSSSAISNPDSGPIRPQLRQLHDPDVTFEEYYYYAQQSRAEELTHPPSGHETKLLSLILPSKSDGGVQRAQGDEKEVNRNIFKRETRAHITDDEWTNASRALRTATRGAIFYLITTDILGPFGLPYAFATMGWG